MNLGTKLIIIGQPIIDYLCKEDFKVNSKYDIVSNSVNKKKFKVIGDILDDVEIIYSASGGCATNTSFGLDKLKVPHIYIGSVGNDVSGKQFIRDFKKLKYVESQIVQKKGNTGKILTFVNGKETTQQITNVFNYGLANDVFIPQIQIIPEFVYISLFSFLGDYPNNILELLQKFSKRGSKILVDGGGLGNLERELVLDLFKIISGIFLNQREADVLKNLYGFDLENLSNSFFIVSKNSAEATKFYSQGKEQFSVPVNRVDGIKNCIGAGDAFTASFLAEFFRSKDFYSAISAGNNYAKKIIIQDGFH